MKTYKTLKQRIKDKHINALLTLSRETNFVFNYVNNLSYEHTRRTGKFFSAFDIASYTKGCAGLGIREWTCACGTIHDRDINAAINILVRGHAHLAGGISVL